MSDMDGFLGKSVIDSIESNKELNRNLDGYKLINQRKINLNQQQQITADREYIRTLEETIAKLKDENHRLKNSSSQTEVLPPEQARHLDIPQSTTPDLDILFEMGYSDYDIYKTFEQNLNDFEIAKTKDKLTNSVHSEYKALLAKPMQVIAEQNGDFKKTYEEQQALLADWMVSQKAFKELAIQFGFDAHGHTPEQVIEMGLDKSVDVLEDKHDPSHRTNVGDSTIIGPRREVLLEKAQKDKAARKAKKSS